MSKRKFKVGDKVVIKPESVYSPKGVVGTVIDYNDKKYTVKFTNGFTHSFRGVELDAYMEEPKKVEKKAKPKKQVHTGKYIVGDKVIVKETNVKDKNFVNKVGTIIDILETGDGYPYKVKLDENGREQWCCVKGYAKEEPKKEVKKEVKQKQHKFKVGDIVKGTSDKYIITNRNMIKGEVVECYENGFRVKVVEHKSGFYTGSVFPVRYEHFEKVEEEPKNTIVIYQKDRDVVALDKTTGKKCYAHCHPDDAFDFKTGAKIAFGRLIGEPVEEKTVTKDEPIKYIEGFEKGKTYIFDKEIYKTYMSVKDVPRWVDDCDGKVVEDATGIVGRIGKYLIGCSWCKEVESEKTPTKEVDEPVDVFFEAIKSLFDEIKKVD